MAGTISMNCAGKILERLPIMEPRPRISVMRIACKPTCQPRVKNEPAGGRDPFLEAPAEAASAFRPVRAAGPQQPVPGGG